MRLFIGINASKQLQRRIAAWRKDHQGLPVRWIKPRNLHITLVPPGKEEDVRAEFAKLQTNPPNKFTIVFNRMRALNKYQVLVAEGSGRHVTVARFKGTLVLRAEKIHWIETVTQIVLFQSKLGPKEANYYEVDNVLVGAGKCHE